MGRLVMVSPHYCVPIPSSDDDAMNLTCRGMEEGVDVRQQPPPTQPNPTTWKFVKTFIRCITATATIARIVWLVVARHLNLDPELQDPYMMAWLLLGSLIPVGFGFMITQGDIETNTMPAQREEEENTSNPQ